MFEQFSERKQLKKLFIPLLLVLKIFKLKLLLFLPMILGLASFKKVLGLLAIVVPGLIGFFKFCKPDFSSGFAGHNNYYNTPQYSPAGVAFQPHFREPQPNFLRDYPHNSYGGVNFKEDDRAQNLAYSGYYRNSGSEIEAETQESSSKKSILPDS